GTLANGFGSTSIGGVTKCDGSYSLATGNYSNARSFCSVVLGRFNDTTNMSSTFDWVSTDPVFVIGNGTAGNIRNNALTVLKNGHIGIGTINPNFPFHIVSNDAGSGGFDDAIVIENTNTTTGEAAILFRNHGSTGTGGKSWITGLDQSRNFSWAYGTDLTSGNTKMYLDSLGNLGLGT